MSLKEFRGTLLRLDHPESVLTIADKYLSQMEEMGAHFVLPKEHQVVKPALEFYAGDLAGWVRFVKSVRDRLPKAGRGFHVEVNELYRKLSTRLKQQERRERLTRAVDTALRKQLIDDDYETKMRYARRCTKSWELRKENLLANGAKTAKGGRLSVEDRRVMLDEFWRNVDAEIQNGELPKP